MHPYPGLTITIRLKYQCKSTNFFVNSQPPRKFTNFALIIQPYVSMTVNAIPIQTVDDPRVAQFTGLTDVAMRRVEVPYFIAESPKVISAAIDTGYEPQAILCEERHITGDAAAIISRCPAGMPVYYGERSILERLTGYTLTRGVLASIPRRPEPSVSTVCHSGARRIVVLDNVCDTTNIGAIFRAAAALGIDGIVLTRGTCDPLNRRAVRVSMGTVFRIPWTWIDQPISSLKELGYCTIAMALRDDSYALDHPMLARIPRMAIIMGTEGDGLSDRVIDEADYTVRIPMHRSVDSLNVASAAAVAFWQLRAQ